MKDRRLDVFFEHCSFRICKHFAKNQDSLKWCAKITVGVSLTEVNCNGDIAKCELEEYVDLEG